MAECKEEFIEENMSDEVKTKSCDSCSFRGIRNPADTYCPVCIEYLCISCAEIHHSFKATRAHKLVQIEESANTVRKMKVPVTNQMVCEIHWSEIVVAFCLTHEKVICRLCKTTKHKNCDTSALGEVAESRKERVTAFLEGMNVLASEFENIEFSRRKDRRNVLQISKSLEAKVDTIENEIITWAAKLKHDALKQIKRTANGLISNIDNHIVDSKEMASLIATIKTSFEKLGHDRVLEGFVLMTKSQQQIQEGNEVKEEIQKKMIPPTLNFYKSECLSKLMSDVSSIGMLHTGETCPIDFREMSEIKKKTDITVDSRFVTGCVFMPNGYLVVCANHTVKILTTEFESKNELECDSQVWDVAVLSIDKVIVTRPYSACLDVLSVSKNIRREKSIFVGEQCWGVDIQKDNIYLGCYSENGTEGKIRVLTLDGVFMKAFQIDEGKPYYLAVNNPGDRIIVCTGGTSKVLCIDMAGNVVFTYTDRQMEYSLGLLFDLQGNFMVCANGSNNIHVVKRNGTKHTILLSSDVGLREPYCLAYRSTDKTLVVGQCTEKPFVAFSIDI